MECGHIQQGHSTHTECVGRQLTAAAYLIDLEDNPFTRCMVENREDYCQTHGCPDTVLARVTGFPITPGRSVPAYPAYAYRLGNRYPIRVFADARSFGEIDAEDCLPLAQEMLARYGLELDSDALTLRLRE